ncbi:membrane fusion protein, multidrug efflux system [Verrucomicrobium sp. GAS474]|uniref:efflux RND transporter periplasmic adaptor subunit n=1 Tax=Verrucomicrobium sp. GAS474 TaxID=1882831 RepID=UPI00087B7147|nr:efflux RND transporter periplasmic adaptor subunit [Verrucomicrobium sp. GAS474]SDT92346.1 membrane fusion protein, multidrug efflux system [Verrucomicrobium sp. GAS474]
MITSDTHASASTFPPLPQNGHAPLRPKLSEPATPMKKSNSRFLLTGIGAVGLLGLSAGLYLAFAGSPSAPKAAAAGAPAGMPPVSVVVETVTEQKMRVWNDFSGRLHAVDFAEIRPEVSGRITEIRFTDGQAVKAGDVLLVIDPRPYEAAVARADAAVASAKSALQLAQSDRERALALIKVHAVTQQEADQAENAFRVASSTLASAEAQLKTANVDFDHAYVKAPITGRVSRAEITVGNLVQQGPGAPLLTSIVSENGIYADFEVDEQTYLETIRTAANGNAQEQLIPVQLITPGDTTHTYDGFIESFDNRLDAASGTIRARAKFANADMTLVPGMFVSVRLASGKDRTAILIHERAISSDQSKKFVFVVNEQNHVAYREIQLGKSVREMRIVEKGLQPGDRVIVDGVQRVRPDAVVTAQELTPSANAVAIQTSVTTEAAR